MAKKPALQVIPTEAWALVHPARRGFRVRGGDERPHVYWTRNQAKEALKRFPECHIQQVEIALPPKLWTW